MNQQEIGRMESVSGVCSQCGRILAPGNAEFGIIDDDEAQAFCDSACLGKWNVAHGLLPWGEVPAQ